MGNEELSDNSSSPNNTLKDYLNELFSYALSIGMSSKEYWDDDVDLINNYIAAEKIKQRKLNTEMWIQGLYFQSALNSVVGTMFGKKRIDYVKEPIPLTSEEKIENENAKIIRFRNQLIARSKKREDK